MEADGKSTGEYCHHIVPSTHPKAQEAREILIRNDIPINSSANGVGLTEVQHYGQRLHTHDSIRSVTEQLRMAEQSGITDAVHDTLKVVEVKILNGGTP